MDYFALKDIFGSNIAIFAYGFFLGFLSAYALISKFKKEQNHTKSVLCACSKLF